MKGRTKMKNRVPVVTIGPDSFRAVAMTILVLTAATAFSATYTWIGDNNSSWDSAESYQESGKPGANDIVTFADGKNATVSDDEFSFVSSLGGIVLNRRSSITFNVTGEKHLGIAITSSNTSSRSEGVGIIKSGTGVLELASPGANDYYRLNVTVSQGVLKFNQDPETAKSCNINSLTVAKDAVLFMPYGKNLSLNGYEFYGEGLVTNACPTAVSGESDSIPRLVLSNIASTFAGTIAGEIGARFTYTVDDKVMLTGTNSTYTGYSEIRKGVVGVKKFGMTGLPSSIGTYSRFIFTDGTLLCLGDELQTTDKTIRFDNASPATIDAGAFGGVTFANTWDYKSANKRDHLLYLTGSNTEHECVFSGTFNEPGDTYATHIVKRGTGIWRLANSGARRNRGLVGVEEGTLRFDSVADAGSNCSLGLAQHLRDIDMSIAISSKEVYPYAIFLGGGATEGVFEYVGAGAATCTNRPIAIKGNARIVNATGFDFSWAHVFGQGDGLKTLTLDGDSTAAVNRLISVTNACGGLSIAKEGAGTWTLAGNLTFNGTVDVREGTLVVERTAQIPTWYRLTIKQNYQAKLLADGAASSLKSAGNSRDVFLHEFALYDANGARINKNLTYVKDTDAYWLTPVTSLVAGQIALEQGTLGNSSRTPALMCDNSNTGDGMQGRSKPREGTMESYDYMETGLPKSWIKVVMRLPAGSPLVTAIDWANNYGITSADDRRQYQIYAFELEGSSDGVNWKSLTNVVGAAESPTPKTWVSDGSSISTSVVNRPGKGYSIDSRLREDVSVFENVTAVSVAAGATLRADIGDGDKPVIKGLLLDPAAGVGTIDGFAFADHGVITLLSQPTENDMTFQYAFANVDGLENLAAWTLSVGPGLSRRIRMAVNGETGTIRFIRPGLCIRIR